MNSKFVWHTQGIWPPCADGTDINFVDRSKTKKYLATADDFSKVKVFRYPVHNKRQLYNQCKGHSSHVTAVKWSFDDKLLFSTGGLEKSIIQWNVSEFQDYKYEVDEAALKNEEEPLVGEEDEGEYDEEEEGGEEDGVGFEEDEGDQALAVKPFLGQVKASTPLGYRPTHANTPPEQDL
jgi:WD40 repeat protein